MSVIDLRRWWWCVMLPLCRGLLCFPCTLLSHRVGRASGGRNTTREPLCFRGLRCPSVYGTLLPFTLWLSRACHGLELSTKTALGNGVHCLLPPHYAGPPPRPRAPAVSTAANSKQQRTNKVTSVTPHRAATPNGPHHTAESITSPIATFVVARPRWPTHHHTQLGRWASADPSLLVETEAQRWKGSRRPRACLTWCAV